MVYVYCVEDCKPVTTIGDTAPLAVYEPGDDVTVYVLPREVPGVNAIDADPLLNALEVPTFVAATSVTTDAAEPTADHPVDS